MHSRRDLSDGELLGGHLIGPDVSELLPELTLAENIVLPWWSTRRPVPLRRRPDLPRHMAGGIENPLGARALYLGSSLYRIHGSNEPDTIGAAVSSGCIRMTNRDVVDLYDRVRIGTKVVVIR